MAEHFISGTVDERGFFTPHPIHGGLTVEAGDTITFIAPDVADTVTFRNADDDAPKMSGYPKDVESRIGRIRWYAAYVEVRAKHEVPNGHNESWIADQLQLADDIREVCAAYERLEEEFDSYALDMQDND